MTHRGDTDLSAQARQHVCLQGSDLDGLAQVAVLPQAGGDIPGRVPFASRIAARSETNVQHQHIWLSVFLRHPRDRVSSKARLAIVYALIVTILALNALFGEQKLLADLVTGAAVVRYLCRPDVTAPVLHFFCRHAFDYFHDVPIPRRLFRRRAAEQR